MTYNSKKILTVAFALVLAATPAFAAAGNMQGRWFTEGVERGAHIQVFLLNNPDGTYEKDIRVIESCEVAGRAKETGTWKFEQNNFATAAQAVDGKAIAPNTSQADKNDLFRVTRIDDEHVNLFDTETSLTWALMLVSPDYAFPPARGCTV